MFPLYEVENGKYSLTFEYPSLIPVRDYFKGQGRFRHLTDQDIDRIQKKITSDYDKLKAKCVNLGK